MKKRQGKEGFEKVMSKAMRKQKMYEELSRRQSDKERAIDEYNKALSQIEADVELIMDVSRKVIVLTE